MWRATTCAWSAELWLPFPTFWKLHQRASSPPVPGTKGIVNAPWELESLAPLTGSKYNSAYELIGKNSNLLMIVGCSFGRWGKSRTFWSLKNFGSASVSEDLETLFPVASGLSNKPSFKGSQGPFEGCLGLDHLQVISSQRHEADCGPVPGLHVGGAEVKEAQTLPSLPVAWLPQQPPIPSLCLHSWPPHPVQSTIHRQREESLKCKSGSASSETPFCSQNEH